MTTYSIPRNIERALADRDSAEWIGDTVDREAARRFFSDVQGDPLACVDATVSDYFDWDGSCNV